jgi:Dual specificity phosphatase, catalytic domain
MGCDTSAMVIPSFYTHDDDAPRSCARSAPPHLVAEESESSALGSRESEIITNLFLGDLQDAGRFDGMIISVLPDAMDPQPHRTIRLPFLANGRATLDSTSALIDAGLRLGMPVLVHCEEGCERAPLAVAWFLKTRRGMTLDEAYALIKSRRPIVKDRRSWLGIYNR